MNSRDAIALEFLTNFFGDNPDAAKAILQKLEETKQILRGENNQ